jgi:hypothetical protein
MILFRIYFRSSDFYLSDSFLLSVSITSVLPFLFPISIG